MNVLVKILMTGLLMAVAAPLWAQSSGPLKIEITEGVIEPMPFAAPAFVAEN
ncbi:MAG: TolB protein, partial [Paracoccaceae bacterium]